LDQPEILGGIVTKSLSIHPRIGNPPPRIAEVTSGMLNSIGLANIGIEQFLIEKEEFLSAYGGKVIVNIAGRKDEEYIAAVKKLTDKSWIAAFEINVSCPNVSEGGIEVGKDPHILGQLVGKLRAATDKFLIIKLSPNVTDIRILATAAQKSGADALSMINTVYGAAIDIKTRRPKINTVVGGFSGPAIKPIALAHIIKTYQEVDIPIIGIGGSSSGADVVEFMLAGARAVQIGTANFFNIRNLPGKFWHFWNNIVWRIKSVVCKTSLAGKSLSLNAIVLAFLLFWLLSCTSAPRYLYTSPKTGATIKDNNVTLLLKDSKRTAISDSLILWRGISRQADL
jgi:dihydroorotate dehydrogenase (NAD+) catalytic subunit